MKIQCDVCNKDQASVYCTADEAALCDGCDHRVHHANKLAGKHQRFSLLHPSPKQTPLCDICQEKRGFLFCQQDRAIMCLGCDIPIHKANEHTRNHNRFLLTGVKLSVTSSLYSSSSSSSESLTNNGGCGGVPHLSIKSVNEPVSVTGLIPNPTQKITSSGDRDKDGKNNQAMNEVGNGSTSSISEYLIEMLPGWHVEDFLDSSSTPSGFSKSGENDLLSFWDADLEGNLGSFSSENMGFLVPQAPPIVHLSQPYPASNMALGGSIDLKDSKEATNMLKSSRKWRDNGCLNVPQISPPYTSSKRSRTLC